MTTIATQVQNITYNPAQRAFEACVTLRDRGETFAYPCALRAPLDMDYGDVTRRLIELARRRHDRKLTNLRTQLDPKRDRAPLPKTALPVEVDMATTALWQRILNRAA